MKDRMMDKPYILVADDDPLILRSLSVLLRAPDYTITTVVNGQEAWEQIQLRRPALAFLDVMMGQISGLDLVKRIRETPELKTLPVFLLTARAMPAEREQGLAAGADDYITKPFSTRELLDRVRSVLAEEALRGSN